MQTFANYNTKRTMSSAKVEIDGRGGVFRAGFGTSLASCGAAEDDDDDDDVDVDDGGPPTPAWMKARTSFFSILPFGPVAGT